jgi:hypothetical protein
MESVSKTVPSAVSFDSIRTRTRREFRLFSRALMRLPLAARISLGIGLGVLTIVSIYRF